MSPERKLIDIDAIKASTNLVEFARQYTTLTQISQRGAGEYAGPCPCCGGEDRFHVRGDHFYCRQYYPRGGDIINFVQLLHNASFLDACRMLTAGDFSISEKLTVHPAQGEATETSPAIDWRRAPYQESARKIMFATHRLLESGEGTDGQAYLLSRSLTEATWRAYRLGYGRTFHPTRRQNLEAIFIPWLGEDCRTITAIQHRFLDPTLEKGERYALKPGSEPILFGLQALQPAETLVIVEGEFNAMSLHQIGVQALSVGSESNVRNDEARALLQGRAPDYGDVVVWFDNPARGEQYAGWGAETGLFRKERIRTFSHEMDANELLAAGELEDVVATL